MISANKKCLGPGEVTREWVYASLKDKKGLELKGPAFVGMVAEDSAISLYRDAISFYDAEARYLHVPKGEGKGKQSSFTVFKGFDGYGKSVLKAGPESRRFEAAERRDLSACKYIQCMRVCLVYVCPERAPCALDIHPV